MNKNELMLRKVEYTTYKRVDGERKEIIQTGYFHKFVQTPMQESKGYNEGYVWVSYPEAIIEKEDGTITRVSPESMRFLKDSNEEDENTIKLKALDETYLLGGNS